MEYQRNLQLKTQNSRLLIISHTEHFLNQERKPSGWIPTVREIDYLASHFKEVIHLAVLYPGEAPESTTPYCANNVRFEHISPFGGAGLLNKLRILWVMPLLWLKLHRLLKQADVFQFRAPTSIGLLVIPVLTLFYPKKKGWYKYAGNWMQPNMPLSYKIQKWMLGKWQKKPVTINGRWPGQPTHVHTFENPCLSEAELPLFRERGETKLWHKPYTACFVGRMEDAKGVQRIIDLLLQPGIEQTISTFHFVGDGPKLLGYKQALATSNVDAVFHGFCTRQQTFNVYAQSHLFLLPSDSEGFPKVVAEAAAFGCVPIVSDVSSIGQYVTDELGYLWQPKHLSFMELFIQLQLDDNMLQTKSKSLPKLANKFTFEHYFEKLAHLI